jgi:hypothetical protein
MRRILADFKKYLYPRQSVQSACIRGLFERGPMKLTRKIYTTRNEKILDFVLGFLG